MNKVDTTVKHLLLAFPTFYPSRWSALCLLFLSPGGGGFNWDAKGALKTRGTVPAFKLAKSGVINTDDLNVREQQLTERMQEFATHAPHTVVERLKIGQERALRQHRAENIDAFAMYHMDDPHEGPLEELLGIAPHVSETNLSNAPLDKLDKHWAAALLETANIVHHRLVTHLELGDGKIRLKDVPSHWQPLYRAVELVRKQLEPKPNKAAVKEISSLWQSVIADARAKNAR